MFQRYENKLIVHLADERVCQFDFSFDKPKYIFQDLYLVNQINFVFQNSSVLPFLTIFEIIQRPSIIEFLRFVDFLLYCLENEYDFRSIELVWDILRFLSELNEAIGQTAYSSARLPVSLENLRVCVSVIRHGLEIVIQLQCRISR